MQQIFRRTPMRVFSCKFATCFQNNFLRRNFSLVARYSLKFTRCSLLVVKSLVTRCKIRSLLVAEVARCKKSLVTCCRSCSLQKSLVTRCKIHSLLVAQVACCKKSLVTYCKIRSLLVAKIHSSLVMKKTQE